MTPESTLVQRIRKAVLRLGCSCDKSHGSVFGQGGNQDILILVPTDRHPYAVPLFVEVKVPGKMPTPRQEKRMRDRRSYKALAIPAWSVEDVVRVIEHIREGH